MPYSALSVANRFLELAKRDGQQLTNMQLQKLVYIAHGWNLAITGRPLFYNDVQAWQWGPVVPKLYQSLSKYGAGFVSELIPTNDPPVDPGTQENALIESVWKSYGHMSARQLSAITHGADTPWRRIRQETGGSPYADIPDGLIAEHYRQLYDERIRRKQTPTTQPA